MLRRLIQFQEKTSRSFDALLPERFTLDGNQDFLRIALQSLQPETTVWDLGGGKRPLIAPQLKRKLNLQVVGLDIDGAELAAAPAGAYDKVVTADIAAYRGHRGCGFNHMPGPA